MMKNIGLFLGTLFILFTLHLSLSGEPVPFGSDLPKRDLPILKVAVLKNFPPQYSLTADGQPTGFAVDTIEAIAVLAGFRVQYYPKENWQEMFAALRSGEVDVIPNQGITARREQWFWFSKPVETFPVVLFTRREVSDVRSMTDFSGRKVAVVHLNIGEVLIQKYPDVIPVVYDDVKDALHGLFSGNVDGLIFPEPVIRKLVRDFRNEERLKVVGKPLKEIYRGISVSKGNRILLRRLNDALDNFIHSKLYRAIYTRWYGSPLPYWTPRKVAVLMTTIMIIGFSLLLFWKYRSTIRLNRQLQTSLVQQKEIERALREAREHLEEKVKERTTELEQALVDVKKLSGLLPICSNCKKIRDDKGYWNKLESFIQSHSDAMFSHGLCPDCAEKLYGKEEWYQKMKKKRQADEQAEFVAALLENKKSQE